MDIVISVISIILACIVIVFAFMGLNYLDNRLQKKKREEYFKSLNECIYDAINRSNKG